jgi:hypothetical protein
MSGRGGGSSLPIDRRSGVSQEFARYGDVGIGGVNMFRKAVVLACAIAGAGLAFAQQTQDIDPDLLAYLEEIEANTGVKRFGQIHLGEMEGERTETIEMTVDPSTYTVIAVICGPDCEEINGAVLDASGKEIARSPMAGYEAVIQLPPGNGDRVKVKVDMDVCNWETCPYAIQAFTQQGG